MRTLTRIFVICMLVIQAWAPATAAEGIISINVRDADIVDVLRLLGTQAGVSLIPDASLRHDRISLHLQDVTFDRAIEGLARAYDLQIRKEGSILLVGTAASMNRRFGERTNDGAFGTRTAVFALRNAHPEELVKPLTEALALGTVVIADRRTSSIVVTASQPTVERARDLIAALDASGGPFGHTMRVLELRNLRASEAVKLVKGLVPEGSAVADDRQNVILTSGTPEIVDALRGFIDQIDRPPPQVMFEVKVVDVTPRNDASNVGVLFGGVDFLGQPSAGATSFTFAHSAIQVNATLNFMMSKGNAKVLATPRLVSLNNHEASLLIGETYPIIYYDIRSGNQQIQTIDIGVKLRMIPTIGTDGSIIAELHPEYSEIQGFQQSYPIIANRKLDSTLRVADGETIVLGGLLREITSETVTKMPLLGDIPILGEIFKNRQKTAERDEIVFLITPHIITGGKGPA